MFAKFKFVKNIDRARNRFAFSIQPRWQISQFSAANGVGGRGSGRFRTIRKNNGRIIVFRCR